MKRNQYEIDNSQLFSELTLTNSNLYSKILTHIFAPKIKMNLSNERVFIPIYMNF
jgi:hypothetical protein